MKLHHNFYKNSFNPSLVLVLPVTYEHPVDNEVLGKTSNWNIQISPTDLSSEYLISTKYL